MHSLINPRSKSVRDNRAPRDPKVALETGKKQGKHVKVPRTKQPAQQCWILRNHIGPFPIVDESLNFRPDLADSKLLVHCLTVTSLLPRMPGVCG